MQKTLVYRHILLLCMGLSVLPVQADTSPDLGVRRAAAVQQAKAGKFDTALPEMKALVEAAPDDVGVRADYLVVLCWAGQSAQAITLAQATKTTDLPVYALSTLAKAARDNKQYALSLDWYLQMIQRQPQVLDHRLGHLMTLIDAQHLKTAQIELKELIEAYPPSPALQHAQLYYAMSNKQYMDVIRVSQQLLQKNPNDIEAQRYLIQATARVGAPQVAQGLAQRYPDAIPQNQKTLLGGETAAQYIRWGDYQTLNPAERYAETDHALQQLDTACGQCDWNTLDLNRAENVRLVFDRMQALRNRWRMPEVLAHYDALKTANIELPPYVLNATGDAYLYTKQPEQALALYEQSLAKMPNNFETRLAKFYALIELERYNQAYPYIDQLAAEQTAYIERAKNPIVRENPQRFKADRASYFARAYGQDLAYADEKLTAMRTIAPLNTVIMEDQALLWRWRGWTEKSEQTYFRILEIEPNNLGSQMGLAQTELDLRDYRKTRDILTELRKTVAAQDPQMMQLERNWDLHNRYELLANFDTNTSSGSTFGSRYRNADAQLYSRPFNENYRAFVGTAYQAGNFIEGVGSVVAPTVGLEYRDRNWRLTGEAGAITQDNHAVTSRFTAALRMSDHLSFNAALGINSMTMPLRGQRMGVNANTLDIGARYRWNEKTQLTAGAGYMDMDDGNQRKLLSLQLDTRLWTLPHYRADVHVLAAASANTKADTFYFNPRRDQSIAAILDQRWITWRRYDRVMTQRLQTGVGNYWQQGYGASPTWMVTYSHEWNIDNAFEFSYGIGRYQQSYDGTREFRNSIFGSLRWLF